MKRITSDGYMTSLKKVPGAFLGAAKSKIALNNQRSGYVDNISNYKPGNAGYKNQNIIRKTSRDMINNGQISKVKPFVEDQLKKANTVYTNNILKKGVKFVNK